MSKPERQKYKIAGPATWELIRAAYLAGESAPAVAERFGVSAHAIRKRISVEKWTKRAYAAALEARGLEPPARPKAVNVAERVRANETDADLGDAPAESAADLERRALAQASAAVTKGRASDAKSFAALAEQMRKRVDEERAALAAEAQEEHVAFKQHEAELVGKFRYAAYLAYCMVHDPIGAPAIFVDCIAEARKAAFGEGDEESLAEARKSAEASRRYFNLDEDRWQEAFAATAGPPPRAPVESEET